jgi:phosphoglycolate phosphatase
MTRAYTALSFDLDGTLVETAGEIADAVNRALADCGVPRQPLPAISRHIGMGAHALMHRLRKDLLEAEPRLAPRLEPSALLSALDRHYGDTAGTSGTPYPGVHEALTALREAGVRLACLTNKERRFAQRVLDRTGLDGYFELVIGGDTLPVKKPHPGAIQHVIAMLDGEASRFAHVGDSRTDIEAARNAGVAAWAVPWGYNAGEPIEASAPDRIFGSYADIAAHVLGAAPRRAASA